MTRTVSTRHLAEMKALAAEGLGRSDIAAITGFSVQTVGKRIGHLVPSRNRSAKPDVARYRRMITAAQAADYGEWNSIARRFGLKDADVLRVVLVRARRRVAEANPHPLSGGNA
jgi:hypothetical protein